MSKNTKIVIKYLIFSLVLAGIGGLIGGLSTMFEDELRQILLDQIVSIWIPLGIIVIGIISLVILLVLSLVFHFQGKQLCDLVNEEDEELYQKADDKLTMSTTLSTIGQIAGTIIMIVVLALLSNDGKEFVSVALMAVALFIIFIFISTTLLVKNIELVKKIYPEKKGHALDFKFEKQWFDSCDELERKDIGEASYYTYKFMTKVFSVLVCISFGLVIIIKNGYLLMMPLAIAWLLMNIAYLTKVKELEKKRRGR